MIHGRRNCEAVGHTSGVVLIGKEAKALQEVFGFVDDVELLRRDRLSSTPDEIRFSDFDGVCSR